MFAHKKKVALKCYSILITDCFNFKILPTFQPLHLKQRLGLSPSNNYFTIPPLRSFSPNGSAELCHTKRDT